MECLQVSNKSGGMKLNKFHSLDDFQEFEEEIQDTEKFASLKLSLSKIGGVTAVDHTRKAMDRMLHNSLMAKMNMKGKKGKFPFGKTQLFQAIIETVRDSHSNVTEVTIKDAIMKQLKYAPERAGGGGRKMQTGNQN
ncbi:uncharacterized protein LOC132756536 [Ruditapes philippinarum]|uniref:uncharacterized protein LOC132756536 n=1 Tax=Ruditapes philippinarum TaxID=129788 RepID=UPI00295C1EC0|nr:uncharacterized protein LOC132756536 [Ruditapes philippinarum]